MSAVAGNTLSRGLAILLRCRYLVLALVLSLTAAAAVLAGKLKFDNSIEVWFLEDDPERRSMQPLEDLG